MNSEWPREVRRRADGAGVVYELPVRPLGGLRWIGLAPVAFSLLFVWGPVRSLTGTLQRWVDGSGHGMEWFSVAFESVFVLAGLIPAALGLMIAFGRCRVEYRNRRLRVIEIAGPLRWTRRFSPDPVRKLEVSFGVQANGQAVTQGRWADLGALDLADIRAGPSGMEVNDRPVLELRVHPREGGKVGLLAGRSEEELRWMATQLRRALGLSPSKGSEGAP